MQETESFALLRMKTTPDTTTSWSDTVWYIITTLFFFALVTIAGYALILQQKELLLQDKKNELSTIADLKTSQLVQWRKERFAEAASIRANAMMTHRINSYLKGTEREEVRREVSRWMANLVDLGEYEKAALFTPDGDVIASTTPISRPLTSHYLKMLSVAAEEHEIVLSDFHSAGSDVAYDINLVIPIMQHIGSHARCIAVLILDIDPAKKLYPIIQSWPTSDETAETLLVRRDNGYVIFLNELRYRKGTVRELRQPLTRTDMPAVRAALGEEGSFSGTDYRNMAVLSAIRIVPGTQWGIVAKIDLSEVLAPLTRSEVYIALTGIFIFAVIVLGLFLWGQRRKAESLRNLFEIQKKGEADLRDIHIQLEQQIVERTSDLTEINSLLRHEMDERKLLELQLLAAKRLEAIGQIAGGVAHEVRNPLNAILTITEALFREKEIESNPEFLPFIQHIRTQVNRLAQLMNDLLDLGRTIPVANLQPFPLVQVCRESLELWKATGMSKNKQGLLESDPEDTSVQVLADGLKLQQVFFNLLENAGHHTPVGGTITIRLLHNGPDLPAGMVAVQVIDQGTGIDEEKLPNVFEPFYTGRKGGTGLGLALVRHFTENMGGTVHIRNNCPPPGCTVEVHIPLYQPDRTISADTGATLQL